MITAIVLIDTDVDRIPEAAQEIAEIDGVSEVYSVTGDTDLVAMVRVRQHEGLADIIADRVSKIPGVRGTKTFIADRVSKIPGVRGTKTFIAFRTYSRHDLESAFALGLDG